MDAAVLDSYSHRPRWLWTNFALPSTLAVAFFEVPLHFDQKVDDILYSHRAFLPVVWDDLSPLALVNKIGAPRRSFPTFMTSYIHSYSAIGDLAWCRMITPKPIPNHWLTNRNVPWISAWTLQLLAFQNANDALCWAKTWILIQWCGLLVYALHCNDIMVTGCCL